MDIFYYRLLKTKPILNFFIQCVDNKINFKMMYNKWGSPISEHHVEDAECYVGEWSITEFVTLSLL